MLSVARHSLITSTHLYQVNSAARSPLQADKSEELHEIECVQNELDSRIIENLRLLGSA